MVDMERDAKEDAKKKVHRLTLEISETQACNLCVETLARHQQPHAFSIYIPTSHVCMCMQVENDANYRLLANFLASFAAQMPYKREVEVRFNPVNHTPARFVFSGFDSNPLAPVGLDLGFQRIRFESTI